RRLDRGPRQRAVRQRLQGAVGGLPGLVRRGPRVPLRLPLRRARRAPGRGRAHQLRRGPPHRARPADGGVSMTDSLQLTLVDEDGSLRRIPLAEAPAFARPTAPLRSRAVYAAVHVVPQGHRDNTPPSRAHTVSRAISVLDAMDTAQRNLGLLPPSTRELTSRTAAAAREALAGPEIGAVFPADAAVSDLVVACVNTDPRAEQSL